MKIRSISKLQLGSHANKPTKVRNDSLIDNKNAMR